MENKNKKALVTGATGMLGARLVFDLLSSGVQVRAVYRSKKRIAQFQKNVGFYCANPSELVALVEWVEGEMLDYSSLLDAVTDVDIVYHSAAMVSFHSDDKQQMFDININGTANLVNACLEKGVKKICFVSSIAALGKREVGELIDENTPWILEKKLSGYSISKFHSEMEIWRGTNEGLEAVVVNPSVILGPGEWHSGSPAFFQNIFKGMKFYPGGGTGFVDVRDVSSAILLLTSENNWAKACNKRYLLNAKNLRYKEAFSLIAKSMKVKEPAFMANKLLLAFAWRMAFIWGKLSFTKPLITRGSVANASKFQLFDGSKITSEFDFHYRPIEESIADIGKFYLNDQK